MLTDDALTYDIFLIIPTYNFQHLKARWKSTGGNKNNDGNRPGGNKNMRNVTICAITHIITMPGLGLHINAN